MSFSHTDARMAFQNRVTMRDVAKAAGVNQSTVSLALRNHRRIPKETRERIRRICDELGYRPHPLLSVLGAVRKAHRGADTGTVLAFIEYSDDPHDIRTDHVEGARRAAEEQGYKLEEFVIGKAGLTPERLNKILIARNIQGIIIGPMTLPQGSFNLDWEQFCTVVIEHTFENPAFDMVAHDNYSSARTMIHKCIRNGYGNVGLVLMRQIDERTRGNIKAAYLYEQSTSIWLKKIPPLILDKWNFKQAKKWCDQYKVQAILTSGTYGNDIYHFTQKNGLAFLCINLRGYYQYSGIDQNNEVIGETAVHLLIDKINRNDRGVPLHRKILLTPGTWHDNGTLLPYVRKK